MASSTADTAADDKAKCTQKRGIKVTERVREKICRSRGSASGRLVYGLSTVGYNNGGSVMFAPRRAFNY